MINHLLKHQNIAATSSTPGLCPQIFFSQTSIFLSQTVYALRSSSNRPGFDEDAEILPLMQITQNPEP